MNLGRLEYWLLDLVVEDGAPIHWVASEHHTELFNVLPHNATESELVSAFVALHDLGLIMGHRVHPEWGEGVPVRLDRDAVAVATREPGWRQGGPRTDFALTASGGAAWEAAAKPDWDRFVYEETEYDGDDSPGICQVEASTPVRALEYLNYLERYHFVDATHYTSTDIAPWEATYWKNLPRGVRFEFARSEGCSSAMLFGRSADDLMTYPTQELQSEFISATPHWYTRPWH